MSKLMVEQFCWKQWLLLAFFFSSLLLSIKAAFHYSLKLSPYSQTTVHHGWHPHCLFLRVNILSMTSIDLRCCSCYLLLFFLLSDANFCKETLKVRNSINLLQKFILIKLTQVKLIDWPPLLWLSIRLQLPSAPGRQKCDGQCVLNAKWEEFCC